eukprot:gnl/Trimastix_PCT/2887.p1 GENE.gnl/Trimastix_PCT/2887~~gnl/Trimastix_PCT/2887.p1  ORF type:complete len:650 (+),score=208.83 gnl/Trimastix_PCT/2887:46-1995(+)
MPEPSLYYIDPSKDLSGVINALRLHPEVCFYSLIGVDFAGHATDERVPIQQFFDSISDIASGKSLLQTDGSSVVLTGLATLCDGKVDMIADLSVRWYIDYNWDLPCPANGIPVGTLWIPVFLEHNQRLVGARSILDQSIRCFNRAVVDLVNEHPECVPVLQERPGDALDDVVVNLGTELEFWVQTPQVRPEVETLQATQQLQENYWGQTRGAVRTAMERLLLLMDKYGLRPEMGHKEVGGIKSTMKRDLHGGLRIMEQLEIDWRFTTALQSADNDVFVRLLTRETFRRCGLEVSFRAKPIPHVAGSGKHCHIGLIARLRSGTVLNLLAPIPGTDASPQTHFLSPLGYGALMGLLRHYEKVAPFVAPTLGSLKRLQPGFEAPVNIVTSLGTSPAAPSRNRTVLVGYVAEADKPMSIRLELRSPSPYSNTYLLLAASLATMLDGIRGCALRPADELLAEVSKKPGERTPYLETHRAYRCEVDVYDLLKEDPALGENGAYGTPPNNVWEQMMTLLDGEQARALVDNSAFAPDILDGFVSWALLRWRLELINRIVPKHTRLMRACRCLNDPLPTKETCTPEWRYVSELRCEMAHHLHALDALLRPELTIKNARRLGPEVSRHQISIERTGEELRAAYSLYQREVEDLSFPGRI